MSIQYIKHTKNTMDCIYLIICPCWSNIKALCWPAKNLINRLLTRPWWWRDSLVMFNYLNKSTRHIKHHYPQVLTNPCPAVPTQLTYDWLKGWVQCYRGFNRMWFIKENDKYISQSRWWGERSFKDDFYSFFYFWLILFIFTYIAGILMLTSTS